MKQKMLEEKTEEREMLSMGQEDRKIQSADSKTRDDVLLVEPSAGNPSSSTPLSSMPSRPHEVVVESVFDDDDDGTMNSSFLPAMESQVGSQTDPGQSAPVTPPMTSVALPPTPRQPHDTRAHGPDDDADHESKRARVESQKKQKISQVIEHNESMIRMVRVGEDNFATLDDYEKELDMMADAPEDDFWCDEDQLQFDNVPDARRLNSTNHLRLLKLGSML